MNSLTSLCGNTPLLKVSDRLYAKLETYNPTGSVKDRMITFVVNHAVTTGKIKENTVLCEATSGNTGIALSSVAASMGFRCVIFMPSNMSEERKQMMKVFGAQVVEAPPDDFDEAIKMRDTFLLQNPLAWSPMQFSNPVNVECHKKITAPEILRQINRLGLKWSTFVHGSGTGGTIEGVRQFCVDNLPRTKVVMTVPSESPHGIQGIGDGRDFLANPDDMDDVIKVNTQDAIARAKQFAKDTGLLVGISSGANILASEEYLDRHDTKGVVVTMLCDRGERYMSIY
mgnify:CR=1 FL=1|tara:strand:- start:735 stop:1589 length:855 start_codon:yes stop_codon:yes gene_type:complete